MVVENAKGQKDEYRKAGVDDIPDQLFNDFADKKQVLVGAWELIASGEGWPEGTTWEFGPDGKATVDLGGAKHGGTYAVEGSLLKWKPEGKGTDALPMQFTKSTDKGKTTIVLLLTDTDKNALNTFQKK